MDWIIGLITSLVTGQAAPSGDMWWVKCPEVLNPSALVIQLDKDRYFRGSGALELAECIDVPAKIDKTKMKSIMSVKLGDLKVGDIINYSSILTVTNESENYKEAWLTARFIILADKFDATEGTLIRRPHGYNCDERMHHCGLDDSGVYRVKKDMPKAYLNLVIYAAGSNMKNARLVINKGYGQFEGKITR